MKNRWIASAVAMVALLGLSCSSELANSGSSVHLLVTNQQARQQIDIEPEAAGCDPANTSIAPIRLQALPKNDTVTGAFTQVRITRYRVSYVRTDGGRATPTGFVRSTDTLLDVGGAATGTNLVVLQPDARNQAPFAALLPNNGGRDPDTGRSVVQLDVIVEVFGETLAGDNVYGATRFPLTFCYHCNGCF
ncbi:MAG TPA: hypothetical protein VGF48_11690 [Thermoanaerobaculia bacterium]